MFLYVNQSVIVVRSELFRTLVIQYIYSKALKRSKETGFDVHLFHCLLGCHIIEFNRNESVFS